MPGLWADAQPYVTAAVSIVVPSLTLWYARRDTKRSDTRTAGQQLTDTLYKEIERLKADINLLKQEVDDACAEAEKADAARREIQKIHDDKMAEWIQYGTTRAEQLEQAKFAYRQRQTYNADHPQDDIRP